MTTVIAMYGAIIFVALIFTLVVILTDKKKKTQH